MSLFRSLLLAGLFVLVTTSDADAQRRRGGGNPRPAPRGAPEIDPAGLGGAVALFVGGTFLLVGRRTRRRALSADAT